jgi:hypothetical protein
MQPIRYISGGLLGDFIHQLGIIEYNYRTSGQKGILYISNAIGDRFSKGLETAYADTLAFIKAQEYIEDYRIHTNEPYDINLSQWRGSPLLYRSNWYHIFKATYNVEWGLKPWLILKEKNPALENTILVNCSNMMHRMPHFHYPTFFASFAGQDIQFIAQSRQEYDAFCRNTGTSIPYLQVSSLHELVTSIASCKLFIGNLSSPLALAHAFHIPNITLLNSTSGDTVHQLTMNVHNPSIQICTSL